MDEKSNRYLNLTITVTEEFSSSWENTYFHSTYRNNSLITSPDDYESVLVDSSAGS